jgi:hypothetical protein
MDKIVRVSELRDENDVLTHKMCCLCFDFIPVEDLFICEHESRWDQCKPCAAENPMKCYCKEDE